MHIPKVQGLLNWTPPEKNKATAIDQITRVWLTGPEKTYISARMAKTVKLKTRNYLKDGAVVLSEPGAKLEPKVLILQNAVTMFNG